MLKKQERTGQFSFFDIRLDQLIDLEHPLAILAHEVDWDCIEVESAPFFSLKGRPSESARSLDFIALKYKTPLHHLLNMFLNPLQTH